MNQQRLVLSFVTSTIASLTAVSQPSLRLGQPFFNVLGSDSIAQASTEFQRDTNSSQVSEADRLAEQGRQQFHRGQFRGALQIFQQVLTLRRQVGDRLGEAEMLNSIAEIHSRLGNMKDAQKLIDETFTIVKNSNLPQQQQRYRLIEAEALNNLAAIYYNETKFAKALETAQAALTIRRQMGDRTGEGKTLILVGVALLQQGQQVQAKTRLEEAIIVFDQPGASASETTRRRFYAGEALASIGLLEMIAGKADQAMRTLERALIMNRETGNRSYGEINTLYLMGLLQKNKGELGKALESYQQLLSLSREIGHAVFEGIALTSLGNVYQAQNQNPQALAAYQQGLAVFKSIGDRSKEAETLSTVANLYEQQQQYDQALKQDQQALAIYKAVNNRLGEALTLQSIGQIYLTRKQNPQALEKLQQALVIFRELKNRPLEGQVLSAIGIVYSNLQQYSQAIDVSRQALLLFGELRNLFVGNASGLLVMDASFGQQHLLIGQNYQTLGQYSESQRYLNQAVQLLQKALGEAKVNKNREMEGVILESLLTSYQTLSITYMAQARYQQSINASQKALELSKQMRNQEREKGLLQLLVSNYALQGQAYDAQRNYKNALESYQQALKVAQENRMQSWQAQLLIRIGQTHTFSQNFTQALSYQKQAQAIIEKINSRFLQAQLLFNRGALYKKLFRYPEALKDFQEAQKLLQATGDSLGAALMSSAIGDIYAAQNQDEQASNAYRQVQKALENNPFAKFKGGINANNVEEFCAVARHIGAIDGIFTAADNCDAAYAFGAEALKKPFVLNGLNSVLEGLNQTLLTLKGASLNSIGQLYLRQGNYNQALASHQQALTLVRQAKSSIESAALGDIGITYLLQGKYDQAVTFSKQAVESSRAFENRINEEDALYHLAIAHWAQGNAALALETLQQKAKVENEGLANNLGIGSEAQKRTFIAGKSGSIDMTVTFYLQSTSKNSEAARLAMSTVLQRKGRILDAVSDNIQRLRRNLKPEDQKLLDDLKLSLTTYVNLFYDKQNKLSANEFKTQVTTLKSKIDNLENLLAQRSTEFRTQIQPVTIESTQALIPTDAALVEFVRYSSFNPKANSLSKRWGVPRYAAAILTRQGNPQWIDLGEAKPIEQTIEQFRDRLQDPSNSENRSRNQLARDLDRQIMQPIRKYLGNNKHILISPDGALNLIPFEALRDEQNQYLIERYGFSYLTSGRDLIRFAAAPPSRQAPVVFSEVDYDRANQVAVKPESNYRSSDLASEKFAPLETAAETQEIKKAFPDAIVFRQQDATKTALQQIQAPLILHLATHGFFLPAQRQDEQPISFRNNPLLRSGLILAGFNQHNPSANRIDNSVLTALEATGLDLYGTQLVVLSACETGLGDPSVGEGIYGLRRALVIAGSQSQVLSLWKVRDDATGILMQRFYDNLKAGKGRHEALRDAQRQLLQSPNYQNPHYWAAFVPSGNWTALPKK